MDHRPDIRLADGSAVWFAQPERSEPTLDALLIGASRLCRYHGHRPWTVLQHLWLCDELYVAVGDGADPTRRLQVLVHDLHKAVVGDVAGPMRSHLGLPLSALEWAWASRIHALVGLSLPVGRALLDLHRIDQLALALEMRAFPVDPDESPPPIAGLCAVDAWVDRIRGRDDGTEPGRAALVRLVGDRIRQTATLRWRRLGLEVEGVV